MNLNAYWRLIRADKPIGSVLLWIPTAWALWIANHGRPAWSLVLLFFLGTVLMRSAGCAMNDIADRRIDKHVRRTQCRPLTSGEISLMEAMSVFLLLVGFSALILTQLPVSCFKYAMIALGLTVLYPFCKRFFQAPQVVLGLAFSMGIPMVYQASGVAFDKQFVLLFILNVFWILAYDTTYALIDREDDLKIGVKSTAILFAPYDHAMIVFFQGVVQASWLLLAYWLHLGLGFYLAWCCAGVILFSQYRCIQRATPDGYLSAFRRHGWYGACLLLGVLN